MMLERRYRLRVSAECWQFLIADAWAEGDLSWDERTLIELFTLAPGTIGIGTNCEGLVSVEVQLWSSNAEFDAQPWDHVVECSIEVPSGRIAVAGCFEILFEDAFSFTLTPGKYRARICFGNQYECGDGDPTCMGHYMIMLWPSQNSDARVIKRSVDLFAKQVS
jgi:hypothetical protein